MKYFMILALVIITSFLCGYFISTILPINDKYISQVEEETAAPKKIISNELECPNSSYNDFSSPAYSFPKFIYTDLEKKNFTPEIINSIQWDEFKNILSFELLYNLKLGDGSLFSEYAIAKNEYSLIDSFIEYGVTLNQINDKGILPIVHAAQYSSFDFFVYLTQVGVEVPLRYDENPNNNIMKAASRNKSIEDRIKILEYLKKFSIGYKSELDRFMSSMALSSHLEENKNFLSQISINEEKEKKINILELMIKNKAHNELISSVPENTIKELCTAERGFNALHAIALNKGISESNILRILQNCDNVDAKGFLGVTPLMYAVKFRHLVYIDFLLNNGAGMSITDNEGRVALDYVDNSPLSLTDTEREFLIVKLQGN